MEISITERHSGNIFIREVKLPQIGDAIPGHVHNYDHTMFFMSGRAMVKTTFADGHVEEAEIEAPSDTLVLKNTLHGVEALTDDVYFCCVFPHRNAAGDVVDQPDSRKAYV